MTQQTSAPCWCVLEYDTEAQILTLGCCSCCLTWAVKPGRQSRKDRSSKGSIVCYRGKVFHSLLNYLKQWGGMVKVGLGEKAESHKMWMSSEGRHFKCTFTKSLYYSLPFPSVKQHSNSVLTGNKLQTTQNIVNLTFHTDFQISYLY